MSHKANPIVIGAFVVGAAIIAVVAVLVLTSGQLFKKQLTVVMYFQGSVKGLNVGAPLSFRGVQIGTVTDIQIFVSPETHTPPRIPVTADINLSSFNIEGYKRNLSVDEFRDAIETSTKQAGLRAQLEMQSLLTGQLSIQVDYFPDTEPRFEGTGDIPEIPTVPTTFQRLSAILEGFPAKEVLDNLRKTVASLADLASDKKIPEAIQSADKAFKNIGQLAANLDSRTRPLEPTLVEARQTLIQTRKTLVQASATLEAAKPTFQTATETLTHVRNLVADDSELLAEIDDLLAAMTQAARSVDALAQTLERRPEAVLKGKGVLRGH